MRETAMLAALALILAGCDQNMELQPKYAQYARAPLFRGGVLRRPPPGTAARDDAAREAEARIKPPLTAELFSRGHQRFDIFCSPCHGANGDGNGIIVQRGMPRPTSYHDDRLRGTDDQHFFDVIANGYGAMYSYASRVSPRDRWAIVAYIRALQLSRNASLDDVPSDERVRLMAEP